MPERIVFILSTARTGTKSLSEGLAGQDIASPHQPPFSRLLTIASNYYLHGWLTRNILEWLVIRLREPQITNADCRYYIQVFSLDYYPARIISDRHENVRIIHIVRDPRTFVPSYLNWTRTRWKSYIANKLVPGWHPSGYLTGQTSFSEWRGMDEFQRVCWYWDYKNGLIENLFAKDSQYLRVRFEDVFLGGSTDELQKMLLFAGVPYSARFREILSRTMNPSRGTYFPLWNEMPTERQDQLLKICGSKMEEYGYI